MSWQQKPSPLTPWRKDLSVFRQCIDQAAVDLQRLVTSPVFSAEASRGLDSWRLIGKAGYSGLVGNFLKGVASNRQAFCRCLRYPILHETVAH